MRGCSVVVLAFALLAGCASQAPVPDAARRELAPTGKLRAGMNLGNALFTTKDAATGAVRGVSVDLMRELGLRLGVPVEFVMHPSPGDVADAVYNNTWDVAVLAIEASRAEKIAFSPPMTEIEATYAVRNESPLKSANETDRAGVRIAAAEKAGYELYLTRTLRNASLMRTKGSAAARDALLGGEADALAGLTPALLDDLPKMPNVRILDGRFMTVNHGLGTSKKNQAGAAYLKTFVEEMIASGFIARSIEANRVKGLIAIR